MFIPVFPGTNCEYDSTKVFERAGANVSAKVFRNLSAEDIRDSVELYRKEIEKAQIVMFPGGFSAGDEPEGSAKFFATAFRNEVVKEALMKLLNERDGLMLRRLQRIPGSHQAGARAGRHHYGAECRRADADLQHHRTSYLQDGVTLRWSPTSPRGLQKAELGGVYVNPVSHGEGRFVASDAVA